MKLFKHKSNDGRVITIYLPEKFDFQLHNEFRNMYEAEKDQRMSVSYWI